MSVTHLTLKWSVSRARDTEGYNIRTLVDDATGKRYRCNGGGYDMTGTVFAEWLTDVHQERLLAIADQAHAVYNGADRTDRVQNERGLYGMTYYPGGSPHYVHLDGGCGIESMVRIAKAAGLDVQRVYDRRNGAETAIVVVEV